MAINVYYRGIDFIKSYVVKYLTAAFIANEKGQLIFTDGTKKIEFSRTPQVIKANSWVSRDVPAVLVGAASGKGEPGSFSKDNVQSDSFDGESSGGSRVVGGYLNLNLDLSVRATTAIERDRLTDTVFYLLAHPDAKDFFQQHQINLPEPPAINGEYNLGAPDANGKYPIYSTAMTILTNSEWRSWEDLEDRLLDIIVTITLDMDP